MNLKLVNERTLNVVGRIIQIKIVIGRKKINISKVCLRFEYGFNSCSSPSLILGKVGMG
jgi:hypothetical protein